MSYLILRQNILSVFLDYVHFTILELTDSATMVGYELTRSYCKFTVVFKRQYFVWVEKLYENLKESFQNLQIDGWGDFEQEYFYKVPDYVTFNLISRKDIPLARKFKDKKENFLTDLTNFMNDYNPSVNTGLF